MKFAFLKTIPWVHQRYQPVVQNGDSTSSDSDLEKEEISQSTHDLQPSSRYVYCNVVFFCLSSLMLALSISRGEMVGAVDQDHKRAWRTIHAPSPILDAMDLNLQMQTLQGSIVNDIDDVLRREPSDEVDAAWRAVIDHQVSWYSAQQLIDIGKDPSVTVKIPTDYGVGDDAYAVETDMLHKIHCLNRIRKDVYFDYYWGKVYPDRKHVSELHAWHTNHCIYILLQSLMCEASTDVVPIVWREILERPAQDFNINRKCGNYEGVKLWTKNRSIPYDYIHELKPPTGQKMAPMNLEVYRILHQPDPEEPWIKNGTIEP